MRTKKSLINVSFALSGQMIGIIVSMIARVFFIRILGVEYLGLSALFTNILTILSLAELGVSSAITYSMYKPVADGNQRKLFALLKIYKKIYLTVIIIFIVLGFSTIPILPFLVDDYSAIKENIVLIFTLYLFNMVFTYVFAHRRSLFIAYQDKYILTIYRYSIFILVNILQIIILFYLKSFILFLIIQALATLTESILVSVHSKKKYKLNSVDVPYLLSEIEVNELKKNIFAMFIHRLGTVIAVSITSILIAQYSGLEEVGKYSNYLLVVTAINAVLNQIFEAITASVGNLGVTSTDDNKYIVFKRVLFLNYWVFAFVCIGLLILFNDFITLWIGIEHVFEFSIVVFIVLRVYIDGIRKTVLTFRNGFGLFWYDRYKAIAEAILIITLSMILGYFYGLIGILIGSISATVITTFYVEPYILYKYGLKQDVSDYFIIITKYIVATFIAYISTRFFLNFIDINNYYLNIVFKLIFILIIPNLLFIILFYRSKEFKFYITFIKKILKGEN